MGARGGLHEGLAVLGTRQGVLELLELPLLGVDLVDAPQRKGGLLELLAGCAAKLADALELGGGILGGGKRLLVGCERGRHGLSRPGVEHLDVGLDGKEALVLVLAAEVYGGPHAGGELAHAGHVSVYLHAAAAVRGDAAAHHAAVGVSSAHEEAALDAEPVCPLPDGRHVRALSHQQLYGREERRLARARLAGEDGEAACRLDGGVVDEGDVADVHLVDHRRAA